jgi:hypothetical protein
MRRSTPGSGWPGVFYIMVDSELRRPAAARLEVYFRLVGDHVRVYGSLTNLSGAALAYANSASTAATISSALTPGLQTGEIEFSASNSDGLLWAAAASVLAGCEALAISIATNVTAGDS